MPLILAPIWNFVMGLGLKRLFTYGGTALIGFLGGGGVSALGQLIRWAVVGGIAYFLWDTFKDDLKKMRGK